MPFPVKIQPLDFNETPKFEQVKPVVKSRFKWLFERQFSSVLRISTPEKEASDGGGGGGGGGGDVTKYFNKDGPEEFEPSSVCLAKMVQNFIEDNNERPQRCGRKRCNCFNRNCTDNSDEELDSFNFFGESVHSSSSSDAFDLLKSLVPCASVEERNLLADTSQIVDNNKNSKRNDDPCRKIVTDNLIALGYNASVCKSRWEKSHSFPAGEYEYVDVMIEGERFIIDIDFRSEFEIARSTKTYKSILQTLPIIFIGKSDRIENIISIVSEAAKQSLKKKGMPFPPWRKADYVKAKWLSPHTRTNPIADPSEHKAPSVPTKTSSCVKIVLIFGEKHDANNNCNDVFALSNSSNEDVKGSKTPLVKQWEPLEIKTRSLQEGVKIVTGLASVIEDKP